MPPRGEAFPQIGMRYVLQISDLTTNFTYIVLLISYYKRRENGLGKTVG